MPKTLTLAFVKGSEMAEIKANKRLVERLRKGSRDAKRKKRVLYLSVPSTVILGLASLIR